MTGLGVLLTVLLAYETLDPCCSVTDPVMVSMTSPDAVGNTVDAASTVNWAPFDSGVKYNTSKYDDGGMGPLFNLARSFVNSSISKEIPYKLIDSLMKGQMDTTKILNTVKSNYLGYVTSAVVGILFIVLFPLIGCCFCCCRCCGNCGGKMTQKSDPSASCKRKVFTVLLLLMVIMTGVGNICVFVSNDRITTALSKFGKTFENGLDDMSVFLDSTVDQMKHLAEGNLNFTVDVVFRDLDSIGFLAGIPVRTTIGTTGGVDAAITSALGMQTTLDSASADLLTVFNQIEYTKTNFTKLKTDIDDVKNDIDTACSGAPCPGVNTTALDIGIDTSTLPDLTAQKTTIDGLQTTNLTKTILDAKVEYDQIPQRVQNESLATVANLKTQVNKFSGKVAPMIDIVNNLKSTTLNSFNPDTLKPKIKGFSDEMLKYNKYRWYGGVGLASLILLVLVLQFLGMAFGVFGGSANDPTTGRGSLSNCGGLLLMASVGFIFIFSALFMLLTTTIYLVGAPLERLVCQPLSDPEYKIFTELLDEQDILKAGINGSYVGNTLFQDPSVQISVGSILKDCQAGKAAYAAFHLENFKQFNLTSMTDYKSVFDIDSQLSSFSVDLSTTTLLSADMLTQLTDFKTAVTGIDFTKFDILTNDASGTDLTAKAADIRNVAGGLTGTSKTNLLNAASTLDGIITGSYADTTNAKNSLKTSSDSLKASFAVIPGKIDAVINSMNTSQEFIRNNGKQVIKDQVTQFAGRVTGVVDSYITDALNALKNDIGDCTPIYNIYSSILVTGFCRYFIDALNGFWLTMGWCIFFFIPSLIFSVKLAKYYRRMDSLDKSDTERIGAYNGNDAPMNGKEPMFPSNKVAHADKW